MKIGARLEFVEKPRASVQDCGIKSGNGIVSELEML
jgi:hypothetical protein